MTTKPLDPAVKAEWMASILLRCGYALEFCSDAINHYDRYGEDANPGFLRDLIVDTKRQLEVMDRSIKMLIAREG